MTAASVGQSSTIFAPASGTGRAAVCVVRVSGPRVGAVLDGLCQSRPPARHLKLRALRHPLSRTVLDHALVAWMPGPDTYTGEDMAELHLHGGSAVRASVCRVLSSELGCRHADPGEFTRRAVLSGRVDLAEAEAIADLIDAETAAQHRQALRQLEAGVGHRAEAWRTEGIAILAIAEAMLDFSDERDVDGNQFDVVVPRVERLKREIDDVLDDCRLGERVRQGFTVVLAGRPNAGKSTLLNALARRDVAIVSEVAGTTRDAIEVRCDLKGLPVTLVDTAGLRDTDDAVERQGVARTERHIESADLVVSLHAIDDHDVALPQRGVANALSIFTKGDLSDRISGTPALTISALTGQGLDALIDAICAKLEVQGHGDALITRERHRDALQRAVGSLGRVLDVTEHGALELAVEDIRLSVRALGEISGHVRVEDVLDRLFATFCIGK